MKDQIIFKGLKSECIIGINDYERKIKQIIIINMIIFHDFSNLNDDIKKTINYSEIYKFTKKFISGTNYYLIETLGDNLAKKIIEKFGVKKISLELFKSSVYEDDETGSIRLERELK